MKDIVEFYKELSKILEKHRNTSHLKNLEKKYIDEINTLVDIAKKSGIEVSIDSESLSKYISNFDDEISYNPYDSSY